MSAAPPANSQIRLGRRRKLPIQRPPHGQLSQEALSCKELVVIPSVIDILANSKIRLCSVKKLTQIQNTSQSIAATKNFRIAAREHTLAPPGRHRPRHSRMSLKARQITPAIDATIHYLDSALYQLQPSFHTSSTEPDPTAHVPRAGKEFY